MTTTAAPTTASSAAAGPHSTVSTVVTAQPNTNTYKIYNNGHDEHVIEHQESGGRGVITTIV